MDTLFYLVWRNTVFRREIRKRVCRDLIIKISLKYLNDNHQYICLLTAKDKIDYNIYFKLYINNREQLIEYNSNQYKHLIDDIEHNHLSKVSEENYIDADMICDGVRRLILYSDNKTSIRGTLPSSITELILNGKQEGFNFQPRSRNGNIDHDVMISSLPNLRKLNLPYNYQITQSIQLPSTLVELGYITTIGNLANIVFPTSTPVKNYKSCRAMINNIDELTWLKDKPWFNELDIMFGETIPRGMIPEHVTLLHFSDVRSDVEDGALPSHLQDLRYVSQISTSSIKALGHLKHLVLHVFGKQLEKDMLPNTLEEFSLYQYNLPLLPDVFPQGLKKLQIQRFNQELRIGVLPQSLTSLQLHCFNREIMPFVIPSSLTLLELNQFNQVLVKNSLPCSSLKVLQLSTFTGSFGFLDPMPELSLIDINVLHATITNLLCKHIDRYIKIYFRSVDPLTNLQDTSIQHLYLLNFTGERSTITSKLVPKHIKTLRLYGIHIRTSGLIPNSCLYLETPGNIMNLSNLIPPTTKHYCSC